MNLEDLKSLSVTDLRKTLVNQGLTFGAIHQLLSIIGEAETIEDVYSMLDESYNEPNQEEHKPTVNLAREGFTRLLNQ